MSSSSCWPFGLTKDTTALLEDGYKYGSSVSVRTTNVDGLTMAVEGEVTNKGALGCMTASSKLMGNKAFSLDMLRVKTDGRVAGEASYTVATGGDDDVLESKLYLSVEDGRHEPGKPLQSYGKFGSRLRTTTSDVDVSVDLVNGPTFRAAAMYTLARANLSLGVEAQINTHWEEKMGASAGGGSTVGGGTVGSGSGSELEDLNVAIKYTQPSWSLSARTKDRLGTLTVAYLHQVTPLCTLGSQLDYGLQNSAQSMMLGVRTRLNELSVFKARVDSSAVVSAVFHQQLSDECSMSVHASVNAHEWAADSHKFGLKLEFDAK